MRSSALAFKHMETVNLTFIGVAKSGKSALVRRLAKEEFIDYYDPTIGARFKAIPVQQSPLVNLNVWDTSGENRYSGLIPLYSKKADLLVFVLDATQDMSSQQKYLYDLYLEVKEDARRILVVTKMDLSTTAHLKNTLMAEKLFEKLNIDPADYIECSAKTMKAEDLTLFNKLLFTEPEKIPRLSPIEKSIAGIHKKFQYTINAAQHYASDTKSDLIIAFEHLQKRTMADLQAGKISLVDADYVAGSAKELIKYRDIVLFEKRTDKFKDTPGWSLVLGAVVGAVVGACLGAALGLLLGPGGMLFSAAYCGYLGAIIGVSAAVGISIGLAFTIWRTQKQHPLTEVADAIKRHSR